MSSSTILSLQSAIAALYQNITLPNGLGTPTGLTVEPDGEFSALPTVVVLRQPAEQITLESAGSYLVQREFIARLYTARLSNDNPLPSASETALRYASDCAEAVEDYFNLTIQRLNGAPHVQKAWISADTADAKLQRVQGTTTTLYAGIAFRHVVEYRRWK